MSESITVNEYTNLDIGQKYSVREKIGCGAFSDVYRAIQNTTGQDVAIKILKSDKGMPDGHKKRRIARFKREMRLCGRLHHPNIVRILDCGETLQSDLYTVFEYIPGNTMEYFLNAEGAFTVENTRDCMLQILDALVAAHSIGIIHRDLKPGNVMIVKTGRLNKIKILDFGISTISSDYNDHNKVETQLTLTNEFLGTPEYTAPEQLRNEVFTFKADLYCWGLIFLECLIGSHPLKSKSTAQVIQKQLSTTAVPIPSPLIDHPLGTLLRWVLEKNVTRRAVNTAHVLQKLKQINTDTIPNKNGYLVLNDTASSALFSRPFEGIEANSAIPSEHRQITVLCCSLEMVYDSSEPAGDFIDELFQNTINHCIETVKQYNGYFNGQSADRFLSVFGYPLSSDKDVCCAVRAALHVSNYLKRINMYLKKHHGIYFINHAGMHTGSVIIDRSKRQNGQIFGMTVVTASKLCSIASKGEILISNSTFDLAENYIKYEKVTPGYRSQIKGSDNLWKVTGERYTEGLYEKRFMQIPLVGREDDMNHLTDAWQQFQRGVNTGILIYGDPGIGKSRFIAEFAQKLQRSGETWIELRCIPEARSSAFHPIFNFIKNQWDLSIYQDPEEVEKILEEKIEKYKNVHDHLAAVLRIWMGLSIKKSCNFEISPQKQRSILMETLTSILIDMCKERGSVLVIEDVHWADPTTLECISLLLFQARTKNIFICMTSRKDFYPMWDKSLFKAYTLNPLNETEIKRIIEYSAKKLKIPSEIITAVIERADGIPLFAEELIRLFETEYKEKKLTKIANQYFSPLQIPNSLKDLLTSRLDRLGPAKETAQLAAALGRMFNYTMISRVSPKQEDILLADLDEMISAGILHIKYNVEDPEYFFHHVLLCDSAYESIPTRIRTGIHKRIALTMENEFEFIIKNQPERIAYQWAGAQEYPKAIEYGKRAAEVAFNRSLYKEAIEYTKTITQWCNQSENISDKTSFFLNQIQIQSLIASRGYGVEEVIRKNEEAELLLARMKPDLNLQSTLYWRRLLLHHIQVDFKKVEQYAKKIFKNVETTKDMQLKAAVYALLVQQNWTLGQIGEAKNNYLKAIELCSVYNAVQVVQRFGHDTKLMAYTSMARVCCGQGLIKKSEYFIEEAYAMAHLLPSNHCIGFAMSNELACLRYRLERDKIIALSNRLIDYATMHSLPNWGNMARNYRSWAENDKYASLEGLEAFKKTGNRQTLGAWEYLIAQIEYETGETDHALHRVNRCIDITLNSGELYHLSEMYCLKARCLQENSVSENEILALLDMAIDSSEKAGTHLFTLRALEQKASLVSNEKSRQLCRNRYNELMQWISLHDTFDEKIF